MGGADLGATYLLCCVLGIAALVDGHHGGWHGLMVTALMTVAPTGGTHMLKLTRSTMVELEAYFLFQGEGCSWFKYILYIIYAKYTLSVD